MADVVIAVGHTIRPWRGELQRYARDFVTGVTIQVFRDQRALDATRFDALLLDGSSSLLNPSLMEQMADRQIPVAAVYDRDEDRDGEEYRKIEALGVSMVEPGALDDLIVTFSRRGPAQATGDAAPGPAATTADAPTISVNGTVIAIGGPGGSGTTEVAVMLAARMAAKKRSTILVDIDEFRPSVARRLGFALTPHIVNAVEALSYLSPYATAEEIRGRIQGVLAEAAVANANGLPFDAIAGLPSGSDWHSIAPDRIPSLAQALSRAYEVVILRLGPSLEDLSRWIDRFGASRSAVLAADRVISVADASPTGIAESIDWLADLRELTDEPIRVVVNRVPPGKFRKAEMVETLERAIGEGVVGIHTVRFDKTLPDRSWFGDLPSHGNAMKDIDRIASALTPADVAPAEPPPPPPPDAPSSSDEPDEATGYEHVIDVRDPSTTAEAR